jgi:hypothetical protein
MRCGKLGDTTVCGDGLLQLCSQCPVAAVQCQEFQHDYRGSTRVGTWVCLQCGATKSSQAISTAVVSADQTPTTDWYC